jgi:hypothetical protein
MTFNISTYYNESFGIDSADQVDIAKVVEYIEFANEYDELVDCECIPDGIYKGLPIDFQIDMNHDQRAVFFAERVAEREQRLHDEAFNAALANAPSFARDIH